MPSDSSGNGLRGSGGRHSLILLWEKFLDSLVERFSNQKHEQRNRCILLFITGLFLTGLIIPGQQFLARTYQVGEIAGSDVRATQDYLLEDERLTQIKRSDVEAAAAYAYTLNTAAAQELIHSFDRGLALVRENAGAMQYDAGIAGQLYEALGVEVTAAEWRTLVKVKDDPALMLEVSRLARQLYEQWVVADKRLFLADSNHGLVVIDSQTGQTIASGSSRLNALALADARTFGGSIRLAGKVGSRDLDTLADLFSRMVRPNLVFNRQLTDERKKSAASAVGPVLFQVKRGEMIVRIGDRISPEQAFKLQKIRESRRVTNTLTVGLGTFGLVMVLFYFPYRFARKNIRKFQPSNKDILLLSLVTVFIFFILKVGLIISTAIGGFLPSLAAADFYYLLPFALGPMLVRILINSEVALVYCAICSPLLGLMFDNSFTVVIYALLGGVVGAHGVRQCKDRGTIYVAGMKVSVVNLTMAVSFQIYNDNFMSLETVYCCLFALAGGLLNAAFVSGTIPLVEALFHYTTDIKLLELANLNSPVLRELMVRAPGTYHHSVLVGNLVESAAEAINANPLQARVAAYYHDIGKISKPHYFIENQLGGENRHDKLSPSMSALILIAHVKEGVELAKEHRLGQPIVDMIRQSHGTALIKFFYGKAKELAAPDQVVDERDFRYPGPKPQTREAGLVLLADAVEAASRTLGDATPARIQGMVQKIINNIFIDGQLDECELTLKNLHEIAKSFNQVLSGIYHHRIDYPEPAYKERDKGNVSKKQQPDDSSVQPPAAPPGKGEGSAAGSGDDLKRLGITR
jgi:putative nucleotidyltransferase with HDIG domain